MLSYFDAGCLIGPTLKITVMDDVTHWEVVGSIPSCAIPKALKMVPVATLLGAQHYKASTGFSSNKISHN